MKKSTFYSIFLEFIQEIYDCENQLVEAMPKMIQNSSNQELKNGLTEHLNETKEQVKRLKEVFACLKEQPTSKKCKGIAGIIEEGEQILHNPELTPAVKDCFTIIAAQKVEHYEIASYGSAIALTKHLKSVSSEEIDFNQILNLLEVSLGEEKRADNKLTKVAEGKFFMKGVNDEIENEIKAVR